VVDHDIFKDDFVKIGFPIREFLVRQKNTPNYRKIAKDRRNKTTPPQLNFVLWSWWLIEYFRHYVSSFHGVEDSKSLAESVAKWGARAIPGIERSMARIQEWVRDGNHRQPNRYPAAMQMLFDVIQLPRISGFYRLDLDSTGQIVPRAL
jgi:hypothetical protein